MRRLAFAACLLVAGLAQAQERSCTKEDAAGAEKAVDRVVSWPQLYRTWKDYRHCDSGSIGELFTDALLRMVVEWKNVDTFAEIVDKDAHFKEFVHRHLQSPAAQADLEAVHSRATLSCLPKLAAFCAELAAASKSTKAQPLQPLPPLTPIK